MVYLQCQGDYDCFAEYDYNNKVITKYSRKLFGKQAPEINNINGWFLETEVGILILYVCLKEIVFRIYNDEFILDDSTEIIVSGPRVKRDLYVINNGVTVYRSIYKLTQSGPIRNDTTPFVDDEDFDIGLLVSNISKSPERKSVLLEVLGKEGEG